MIRSSNGDICLEGVEVYREDTPASLVKRGGFTRVEEAPPAFPAYRFKTPSWSGLVQFSQSKIITVAISYTVGHAQDLEAWSAADEQQASEEHDRFLLEWLGRKSLFRSRYVFAWGSVASELDIHHGDASIVVAYS